MPTFKRRWPADPVPGVIVRRAQRTDDLAALGRIVIDAYTSLPGWISDPGYEEYIADVGARFDEATVVGAFDDSGRPVGCVTYVADVASSMAEFDDHEAAGFRMLGVSPGAQGTGAGRALVAWCVDQAQHDGKRRIVIHSTDVMQRAHRLYESFGFLRRPEFDWEAAPGIWLRGFVLEFGEGGSSRTGKE
jgi:GNAT superfamily N-acetyltransferase